MAISRLAQVRCLRSESSSSSPSLSRRRHLSPVAAFARQGRRAKTNTANPHVSCAPHLARLRLRLCPCARFCVRGQVQVRKRIGARARTDAHTHRRTHAHAHKLQVSRRKRVTGARIILVGPRIGPEVGAPAASRVASRRVESRRAPSVSRSGRARSERAATRTAHPYERVGARVRLAPLATRDLPSSYARARRWVTSLARPLSLSSQARACESSLTR